jgi:3-isopropylmalate/(R)-2-methylmalate dehydratase small subunit
MRLNGTILALPFANIDTDQIIPAHHLTVLEPGTLGNHLFDGHPALLAAHARVPDATIVVAYENFACGSSREHAVWALQERGIKAVIAPSFSRIFLENAYNNGLVPVVLDRAAVERCMTASSATVDVVAQTVTGDGVTFAFELDPERKPFLLDGGYLNFLAAKIPAIREWDRCRA